MHGSSGHRQMYVGRRTCSCACALHCTTQWPIGSTSTNSRTSTVITLKRIAWLSCVAEVFDSVLSKSLQTGLFHGAYLHIAAHTQMYQRKSAYPHKGRRHRDLHISRHVHTPHIHNQTPVPSHTNASHHRDWKMAPNGEDGGRASMTWGALLRWPWDTFGGGVAVLVFVLQNGLQAKGKVGLVRA